MKVCFIYTTDLGTVDHPLPVHSLIPLGFASVITCVLNAGHEVELLVFHNRQNNKDISEQLFNIHKRKNFRLFCLTVVSSQMPYVLKVAQTIKKIDPDALILIGGSHPILNPDACINHHSIDMVCAGEGEHAVPALIDRLERKEPLDGLHNIIIKQKDNSIIHAPLSPWIEDLDSIPFINRDIWRPWIKDFYSLPPILIGRGCPNRCSYCSNHAIKNVTSGQYVRYRSAANIIQEILYLRDKYPGIHNIYFEIETAGINLENIFTLCDKLSSLNSSLGNPIDYRINISPNRVVFKNKAKIVDKFLSANLRLINIGLESGSERIRNEILNRPKHSNKEFIEFCKYLQEGGVSLSIYAMVGFPTETHSDFQETLNLLKIINPSEIVASIFHPYPGTQLFSLMQDMGYIKGEELMTPAERRVAVLSYPNFSKKEIQKSYLQLLYLHEQIALERMHVTSLSSLLNISKRRLIYMGKRRLRGTWVDRIYKRLTDFQRQRQHGQQRYSLPRSGNGQTADCMLLKSK